MKIRDFEKRLLRSLRDNRFSRFCKLSGMSNTKDCRILFDRMVKQYETCPKPNKSLLDLL